MRATMDLKNLADVSPFPTKDGSEIRELLAYRNSCLRRQSLAAARLPVGGSTQEHYHPNAEEIYFITQGLGKIRIVDESREVRSGVPLPSRPGCATSCGIPGRRNCGCCVVVPRRMSMKIRS